MQQPDSSVCLLLISHLSYEHLQIFPRLSFRNFTRVTPAPFPGNPTYRDFTTSTRDDSPSSPSLCVYGRVTRLAQRDQVTTIVCAAFAHRQSVVDFFSRHEKPTLETQPTKQMFRSIFVTEHQSSNGMVRFINAILFLKQHIDKYFHSVEFHLGYSQMIQIP